jgi:hypothetical protein
MRQAAYEWLCLLFDCYGPREFGKLCQKILAISYRRAGFSHVVERGVQGVDVDAAGRDGKYTTEVKTTINGAIVVQAKDVAGLAARRADGYVPLLAVLRLAPLSDWLLAEAEHLAPGRLELDQLRPYRHHELENRLRPLFAVVVEEHAQGALAGGQAHLDGVLRRMGVEQRERRNEPRPGTDTPILGSLAPSAHACPPCTHDIG